MDIIQLLLQEMELEAQTTRKMLKLVLPEKFAWKPHQKSMTLKQLSVHIAELPSWVRMGLTTSGIDFAVHPYQPAPVNDSAELIALFEKSYAEGRAALQGATEADLLPQWTLRQGDQIFAVMNKYEVIRHAFSQTIHHRAQLGVYLRLLNIPIPGSYGPSADEMN